MATAHTTIALAAWWFLFFTPRCLAITFEPSPDCFAAVRARGVHRTLTTVRVLFHRSAPLMFGRFITIEYAQIFRLSYRVVLRRMIHNTHLNQLFSATLRYTLDLDSKYNATRKDGHGVIYSLLNLPEG
jgi:hypothetical protein